MPLERRSTLALGAVLAAALTITGVAAAAKPPRPSNPPNTGTFDITGSIDGLLPTLTSEISVKVENPHTFAVEVIAVSIVAGDPPGACDPGDLEIEPVPVPFEVPASGEVRVDVPVRLAHDVDNACQGASWPLAYTAEAERTT